MSQTRRALIICAPDAYANAIKPAKLLEYCRAHNYSAELYSTTHLSRMGATGIRAYLPGMGLRKLQLYGIEALDLLASKCPPALKKSLKSRLMLPMLRLRGRIVAAKLRPAGYDLIICE